MSMYEFLFEAPPAKKSKNKEKKQNNTDSKVKVKKEETKKEETKSTSSPKEVQPPKAATYNDVVNSQNLKDFNFNKRYQEKANEYQSNKDKLSDLRKYIGELSITGKRLSHTQKYTFQKLFKAFQREGYSYNLSYALCLLFFEESKYDKEYGSKKTINPTTKAMGLTQWIRSRFADFVLYLRKKTHEFKNLEPETLKKLSYFLNITQDNAKNDEKNKFSVSIDRRNNQVSDEEIEKFNEILWSQKEMVDYQVEFLIGEFNSKFYRGRFEGTDVAARELENQSKDIYSETPFLHFMDYNGPMDPMQNDPIIPPLTTIDEKTPLQLLESLTTVEKNFLNQVISKFMIPNKKKNQTWDSISNERVKKGFEVLYNNITRRLDTYDLTSQHFKTGEYTYTDETGQNAAATKNEFNNKKQQLEDIATELENNIKKNLEDYPFISEIYEIKEKDLLSTIVKNKGITWKSLVRYNLPFFVNYFKNRKDKEKDIYTFASKFYGILKTKILIPKYNCIIVKTKQELQKVAEADGKTVEQLIAFNESEFKEIENDKKEKIKEPIHKVDPDCKHTQIIFLENSNNKLSEQLIRNYIQNILLEETTNLNKPYGKGDVKDMLLDNEGWITDPNNRQTIKNWYLKMGLAHNY